MQVFYHDTAKVTEAAIGREVKRLDNYRQYITEVINNDDDSVPEYSLAVFKDENMLAEAARLKKKFSRISHLIVVGIGGSSLGIEAIDAALDSVDRKVQLHVLDTISSFRIQKLLKDLRKVRARDVAVCIISKSGNTTETLANASVLLESLRNKMGKGIYSQSIFIGNPDTSFLKEAKDIGAETIEMPEIVGGRYSVFTAVGIIPLTLLGHDIEEILTGFEDSSDSSFEEISAENAARIYLHAKKGDKICNFFGFDVRLQKLGFWYRQLFAESIGKPTTKDGKVLKFGMLPVVTTPVELHSVAQLYFSKFPDVYTDIVLLEEPDSGINVPDFFSFIPKLSKHSMDEILLGIYKGVESAYQESNLPYRSTILEDESLPYSIGQFMGMRMRETMYVAELMNVNAFDQPNVELYKKHTKRILNI